MINPQSIINTHTEITKIQTAMREALTEDQQMFISANLEKFVDFLHSGNGKKALQTFVEEWQTAP